VKTAKVSVVEVRVLYAHSAAWIALLVLEAGMGQMVWAELESLIGRMVGKLERRARW
jgi:hypothetical protein